MLARLQQLTTLCMIAFAAAWAAYFSGRGEGGWAIAGALSILFGYAAFLAAEFFLLALTAGSSIEGRPTAAQLLRAWWGEVRTAPQVFCWQQPFRSDSVPDYLPRIANTRRGVVLVHGFVCNRGLWNPWMASLRQLKTPFVAVNLEPIFGSIDGYVGIIDDAVRKVESSTGLPPIIVAHSMGGLAARAWLSSAENDARVHRVITIGSPHKGTWLARLGHTVNGKQMRIGGEWLRRLAESERDGQFVKFTCIHSHCDNIVFPSDTATLPEAENRHVPATAHVRLAFEGTAFNELLRWLKTPTPGAATAPSCPQTVATKNVPMTSTTHTL